MATDEEIVEARLRRPKGMVLGKTVLELMALARKDERELLQKPTEIGSCRVCGEDDAVIKAYQEAKASMYIEIENAFSAGLKKGSSTKCKCMSGDTATSRCCCYIAGDLAGKAIGREESKVCTESCLDKHDKDEERIKELESAIESGHRTVRQMVEVSNKQTDKIMKLESEVKALKETAGSAVQEIELQGKINEIMFLEGKVWRLESALEKIAGFGRHKEYTSLTSIETVNIAKETLKQLTVAKTGCDDISGVKKEV